jgi:uncharacterized protein (DUF983 family)
VVARALRLRCPRCGESALFAGPFTMQRSCASCGLVYEREPGYFVGAIYLNYGVTALLALGVAWSLDLAIGLTLRQQLVVAIAIAALVPLAFFRYSRSLWLALDYLVTRADDRRERRRHPR